MKVRLGFVSNSSSSSFLAVGVSSDSKSWKKVMKALDLPEGYDWEDEEHREKLADWGYGSFKLKDGSDIVAYGGYEFFFIGFDAESMFNEDMKLSEIKQKFRDTMKKKYGVTVDLRHIKLECGECSSE